MRYNNSLQYSPAQRYWPSRGGAYCWGMVSACCKDPKLLLMRICRASGVKGSKQWVFFLLGLRAITLIKPWVLSKMLSKSLCSSNGVLWMMNPLEKGKLDIFLDMG